MRCPTCEKESTNRRVCPHCFTPYPADAADGAGKRKSSATPRVSAAVTTWPGQPAQAGAKKEAAATGPLRGLVEAFRRQSPIVRWSSAGIALVLLLWAFTGRERSFTQEMVERVQPDERPMSREEAIAHIRRTRETALVETQADEVHVSYGASTFPVQPEGQLALVRQFIRADEIVEGRKRRIFFYAPSGRLFAQADGAGGVEAGSRRR